MILELDCGNSFIKWRVLDSASNEPVFSGGAAGLGELISQLTARKALQVARARLVSVRSNDETRQICCALSDALSVPVDCATAAERLGGVLNGYHSFDSLGLDRWMALVGAYDLCRQACLVLDLGTAVTIDLVAQDGRHLGGYICPGFALLRHQLFGHTRRIHYDAVAACEALGDTGPGRGTAEAVERGCSLMLRSYIEAQILAAAAYLGSGFVIYATGGDASLLADMPNVQHVPDLVFKGLAIACP